MLRTAIAHASRFSQRRIYGTIDARSISRSRTRESLSAELREPLDDLPPGIAFDVLTQLDRALDAGNLPLALALERLLPSTLGTDPAIVDRLVTLRILEGDVTTAAAGLGTCPIATPRLDFLRRIVAIQLDQLDATSTSDSAEAPILAVMTALVGHVLHARPRGNLRRGFEAASDATAAACAVVARRPSPVATLTFALIAIENLLDMPGRPPAGSLASAVLATLRGVAVDLGITLGAPSPTDELAVTPSDRQRLRLRAA
ncbi:MAG: hypothetical protein SGJ09_02055 [Phycisphaerae bacterium]|nr:hypothetical protein [Phycisphaerae bacterium]